MLCAPVFPHSFISYIHFCSSINLQYILVYTVGAQQFMEDFKWLYALKSGILFINCYHAIINYYAIITKYVLPKNTSARLIHERVDFLFFLCHCLSLHVKLFTHAAVK